MLARINTRGFIIVSIIREMALLSCGPIILNSLTHLPETGLYSLRNKKNKRH